MIIAGDWNKNIGSKAIEVFFIEIGVFNIHNFVYRYEDNYREAMYKYGTK